MANVGQASPGSRGQRPPRAFRPRRPVRARELSLVTVSLYGFWRWQDVSRQPGAVGQPADPGRALAAVTIGWLAVIPPSRSVHRTTAMIAEAERRAGLNSTLNWSAAVAVAAVVAGVVAWFGAWFGWSVSQLSRRHPLAADRDGVRRLRAAGAEPGDRPADTGGTLRGRRCRFRD